MIGCSHMESMADDNTIDKLINCFGCYTQKQKNEV